MDYKKQANDFLAKNNAKISIEKANDFLQVKPSWANESDNYGIKYNVILSRGDLKPFKFGFWDSVANKEGKKRPNNYDILACLTKYDPIDLQNFCNEYGYDELDEKTNKTFKAVLNEYNNVNRLFSDVIDELQEIN